ncbi:MAG: porphobilinogen synthase [Nitrososphaerota archaeon]|jgi:porphobilinogen synthase|nr:porphobilinogen synthase [Nitrososphaerota archaeon]
MSETTVDPSDLIAPIFVRYGRGLVEPVASLPGVSRYSVDEVGAYSARLSDAGVRAVLLFGIPETKDETGTQAYAEDGIVPSAIREIKRAVPSMIVMADVCLCEYTSHGHCGVVRGGQVDNDETLPLLGKAAVAYAKAGADVVAPSAMMDFQVRALREALDESRLQRTLVMGYSAKFASSFYGPFREAACSAPSFGDRRGYQMPPGNAREALREIEADVGEGADLVMVKPALPYLDVISRARERFDVPIAAYNVSGEYAMVKAAGSKGWIDEKAAAMEVLTSIKRAGADLIITYFAEEAASWLGGSR